MNSQNAVSLPVPLFIPASKASSSCFSIHSFPKFAEHAPAMPTNQVTQLDKNLKDCQKHDLDWTLLPKNLKEVSILFNDF